jgi:transcriptional regulator with XRE-family HTH domain
LPHFVAGNSRATRVGAWIAAEGAMPRRNKPDTLSLAVGQRIRALRIEDGMTMEELAHEADAGSKGHISSIEKGLVRPNIQTLKAVADGLGVKPLVYRRDSAQSASDCYLPIPFGKHIKITADKAHGQYYHFNYLLFPKDKPVASFRLPLTEDEQIALTSAAHAWSLPAKKG